MKSTQRPSSRAAKSRQLPYQVLEIRQVLAALFPTYVDGVFTLGDPDAVIPYALEDTFKLSSNFGYSKTIYLDFDGHHSVNNDWGHDIMFDPYDRDNNPAAFSDAELIEIQKIFQNAAEDFAPFEVNVTTTDPGLDFLTKTDANDETYGIRVVITQGTPEFNPAGVAFLNSFDDAIDNPCFVTLHGESISALVSSHETGHTLGLIHDGLGGAEYHPGVNIGDTIGWGPIMGAPGDEVATANITQWSNGAYVNATNVEDDLSIMTKPANGFGFKADDHGDTRASASDLDLVTSTEAFDWGFITTRSDRDVFRFETGDGMVQLRIDPFQGNPNLDISARLFDEFGSVIATHNPSDDVFAEFSLELVQGIYFLEIDGVGNVNNQNNDYGSLGFFSITGTIVEPVTGPQTIGESGVVHDLTDAWRTVTLNNRFRDPVVIAGPASYQGRDPLTIRVRNVNADSFEIRLDEWDYRDGRRGREVVSYLVVEAGEYTLANGAVLKAGNVLGTHRWKNISFETELEYNAAPIVFAQIVSNVEQDAATARIRNVSGGGFSLRVQEEQASDYIHGPETVSYVALSRGMGDQEGLMFDVSSTPNQVTEQIHVIDFNLKFAQTPAFFADMQTYNGGDPATVRYRSLNGSRARVFLEEERSLDAEIRHNPEVVGYLAMETGDLILPPPTPPMAPLSFMTAAYRNDNAPDRLAAALAIQQSWGEESWLDFHGDDNSAGGCCCASCLASAWHADESGGMLWGMMFQPEGVETPGQEAAEIAREVWGGTASAATVPAASAQSIVLEPARPDFGDPYFEELGGQRTEARHDVGIDSLGRLDWLPE